MVLEKTQKAIEDRLGLPRLKDIVELREVIPMVDDLIKTVARMPEARLRQVKEILQLVMDIKGGEEELRLVHDLVHEIVSAPKERIREVRGLIKDLDTVAQRLPEGFADILTKT